MAKRTLLPTDFRDFLAIISFIGFISLFLQFSLDNPILSEIQTPIFLIVAGAGLLFIGKIFQIKKWLSDGLQSNEFSQVFAGMFGVSAMIIGFLMLFNVALPEKITGLVGFIALGPAVFILIDYFAKNS